MRFHQFAMISSHSSQCTKVLFQFRFTIIPNFRRLDFILTLKIPSTVSYAWWREADLLLQGFLSATLLIIVHRVHRLSFRLFHQWASLVRVISVVREIIVLFSSSRISRRSSITRNQYYHQRRDTIGETIGTMSSFGVLLSNCSLTSSWILIYSWNIR
jgi:hypothetical protein